MNRFLFKIERQGWLPGLRLHVAVKKEGRLSIAQPAQFQTREEGVYEIGSPLLEVENEVDFQPLLDQLWALGLRPSDIGTTGHLAATQAHLNDMRVIVSKQLEVTFLK